MPYGTGLFMRYKSSVRYRPDWLLSWLSVVLLTQLACSTLPEYAAPRGGIIDPSEVDRSDTIRYRELSRDDFRAEHPPAHLAEHANKLGALTCAHVVTTPETGYQIQEQQAVDGSSTFRGKLTRLAFVAEMDRKCSWWNASQQTASETYVLQHEQIHFALAELAARRQNEEAKRLVREFEVVADSADEAKALIEQKVTSMAEEAMEDLLEENEDFDEETSLKHDPTKQQVWFDRVTRELAKGPNL